jgi:hypothetical protein
MSIRRALRIVVAAAVAIMAALLIAGCGPTSGSNSSPSNCAECKQLESSYSWLQSIGLDQLWDLVEQYGPDIAAILVAALAAS